MMVKIEVGTLAELDVKPGDVVTPMLQCASDDASLTIGNAYEIMIDPNDGEASLIDDDGDWCDLTGSYIFRIISRASDMPKTWGEMTNAEKGELLLADHEGRTIQLWHTRGGWVDSVEFGAVEDIAYRIKPKPVRETVTLRSEVVGLKEAIDYITKVINDHPDLDSIKMEEV